MPQLSIKFQYNGNTIEAFDAAIRSGDGEIERFALLIKEPFEMVVDFGYINCKLEYFSSSFRFCWWYEERYKKSFI